MIHFSKRKKMTAPLLTLALFLIAGACAVMASLGIGWRGAWYSLCIVTLVAAIQISQRYLLSGYEYRIDPAVPPVSARLTVVRHVGRMNPVSVLSLPLTALHGAIPYRKPSELRRDYGNVVRMSYCADLFPAESYWLLFEAGEEMTAVRLQCGPDFIAALLTAAGREPAADPADRGGKGSVKGASDEK